MRRIGIASALIGALVLTAPAALADSGSCYQTGGMHIGDQNGGISSGGFCEVEISCPASHHRPCTVTIRAEARGTGLLGVVAEVDGDQVATCSYTPDRCTAKGIGYVRAGDFVLIGCRLGEAIAIDVTLECLWTVR